MDIVKDIIVWLLIAVASAPIWGALLWSFWQGVVRPRLIPAEDIELLATELLKRHGGRAAEVAYAGEFQAWRHSDSFERGKWRRVRRQIERRRT